jgi:hypothetical protein
MKVIAQIVGVTLITACVVAEQDTGARSLACIWHGPVPRARTITIPEVKFKNATISQVLDYLRTESLRHDKDEYDKRGVNFVLVDPDSKAKTVTMKLQRARVSEIAELVAKASGLKIRQEKHAIVFTAPGSNDKRMITEVYPASPSTFSSTISNGVVKTKPTRLEKR